MVRDDRLPEPDVDAVAEAVRRDCGRDVADAEPVSKGINAIYRLTFADGERAVLKAATFNSTAELRPEPLLLEQVARRTTVSVPTVLETVEDGGELGVFYYLLDHVDGGQVDGLADLPPDDREQFVREVGQLLARLHEYCPVETCGPLRVASDGDRPAQFTTTGDGDSWGAAFASLADHPVGLFAQVHGGGAYADDYGGSGRFADLVPDVLAAFEGVADGIPSPETPTVLHRDVRPDNLVLASESGTDPLVRAVIDFGDPYVGDYRMGLAFVEDATVNVELPLSDDAARLRTLLRTAYARERGIDREEIVGERYAYYLLVQRCRWMAVAVDWDEYDDPAAVEDAYRSFVRERLAEIG